MDYHLQSLSALERSWTTRHMDSYELASRPFCLTGNPKLILTLPNIFIASEEAAYSKWLIKTHKKKIYKIKLNPSLLFCWGLVMTEWRLCPSQACQETPSLDHWLYSESFSILSTTAGGCLLALTRIADVCFNPKWASISCPPNSGAHQTAQTQVQVHIAPDFNLKKKIPSFPSP